MAGQRSRRMTLGVGRTLRIGAISITLLRDNANGSVLLDVAGGEPAIIDRERRPQRRLRASRREVRPATTR